MRSEAIQATRARGSDVALHGVYEVTKLLAAAPEPRAWLPEALNVLCRFFELNDAAIGLRASDGGTETIGAKRAPGQAASRMDGLMHEALRRALITPSPWIVESEWEDAALCAALPADDDPLELDASFVSVPIRLRDRVLGVLCIERRHGPCDQAEFCFDADVRLLSAVANLIAATEPTSALRTDKATRAQTGQDTCAPLTHVSVESGADTARPTVPTDSCALGNSACWRLTLERARAVAKRSTTVLLRGESGTGKEVLARLIHEASPRKAQPFVSLNCAALSETVLSSELFGHERGAFTGAMTRHKGRFELADGGTLFLDEIGEISSAFQASLLRVLQLGEFERVGGTNTLRVNVRLIAATNRNLEAEVRSGRFRADLYYRISVVPLQLPALRERVSDIALLAREFLHRFNTHNGTRLELSESALAVLQDYPFPGNVRELENSICRAATLATSHLLSAHDFAWMAPLQDHDHHDHDHADHDHSIAQPDEVPVHDEELSADVVHEDAGARERLIAAMERAGWVQAKAARILGLTPRQVAYALHKHGIQVRKF